MNQKYEILAPALVCLGNELIPCGLDILSIWRFKSSGTEHRISVVEPIRSLKSGFHWLVDGNGKLVMFHELERRPKTPELLKRFINFTRIHYRLDEPRSITLREMKELTKGKHGSTRNSLAKASDKHGIDTILTKQIFLTEIMEEPDPTVELRFALR